MMIGFADKLSAHSNRFKHPSNLFSCRVPASEAGALKFNLPILFKA